MEFAKNSCQIFKTDILTLQDAILKGDRTINDMTQRYKIGLIGYGTIGKVHEKVITSQENDFKLVAICDLQKPTMKTKVRWYKNYKELLKESIDAVSIATPPSTHYQIALDYLKAGKHVLVEKPPTINSKKGKYLAELASEKGVTYFTAFHMRYNPAVVFAATELVGVDIRKIEITFKEYVFNFHDPDRWIFNPKVSGGGVLMDSGVNALSVIKNILQDNFVFDIQDVKLTKGKNMEVEIQARVQFTFSNNGKGTLKMDWLYKHEDIRLLNFYSKNDCYTVNINEGSFRKNKEILFQIPKDTDTILLEYIDTYKHFVSCLEKRTSFVSHEELEFVEKAYLSRPGL